MSKCILLARSKIRIYIKNLNEAHKSKALVLTLLLWNFSGCANAPYKAKPLQPQASVNKILNKDPADPKFHDYLRQQGVSTLPIKQWGLDELTLCALYFNPTLDVAKARWAAAQSSIMVANQTPKYTINANIGHSNHKKSEASPWLLGVSFDIPIETANKQEIRTEQARIEADIAHFEIAQTAWLLRNNIAQQLLNVQEANTQISLLHKELSIQNEIILMLEKRFKLGLLSSIELNTAKLAQLKTVASLQALQQNLFELKALLAASVGLSADKFNTLKMTTVNADSIIDAQNNTIKNMSSHDLQDIALLNRLDIRSALLRYAAAEANLKLEIAKQTPDILLSPSYLYEYGNSVWSLGISSLLNLINSKFNKNQALIQEAVQLREVESAQFEALQAKIIGEVSQKKTTFQAAYNAFISSKERLNAQQKLYLQNEKQFYAGQIDRLAISTQLLLISNAEQNVQSNAFNALRAAYMIEGLLQQPLFDSAINLEYPLKK